MKKFNEFITEKARTNSSSDVLTLAADKSKTEELRELINAKHKITKDVGKISATTPEKFVTEFNKALTKNKAIFTKIFNDVPKGVGPGEVLLAYLSDNVTIGGGRSNFDVELGTHKIEVKAPKVDKNLFAYNFRLGVDSRGALINTLKEIKALYKVAKFYIDEINNDEMLSKIDRGEMTSLKKHLKGFDPSVAAGYEKLDINVFKNQKVIFQGKTIGKLTDKDILSKLKTLATTEYTKIKGYDEIETGLEAKLSSHKMKYFFFNIDTLELYYKPKLSGSVIDTITGGSIKVRVPL